MDTIFVSIASYRDSQCSDTILDLYSKADNPELVFVGICEQNKVGHSEEICISDNLPNKYKNNIRIIKLNQK